MIRDRFMYLFEMQYPLKERLDTLSQSPFEIMSNNPGLIDIFYKMDALFRSHVDTYVSRKMSKLRRVLQKLGLIHIHNNNAFEPIVYTYLNLRYSGTTSLMDLHRQ